MSIEVCERINQNIVCRSFAILVVHQWLCTAGLKPIAGLLSPPSSLRSNKASLLTQADFPRSLRRVGAKILSSINLYHGPSKGSIMVIFFKVSGP